MTANVYITYFTTGLPKTEHFKNAFFFVQPDIFGNTHLIICSQQPHITTSPIIDDEYIFTRPYNPDDEY